MDGWMTRRVERALARPEEQRTQDEADAGEDRRNDSEHQVRS